MSNFEISFSALKRECTWCGREIPGGIDCLVLHEEDDDYYFAMKRVQKVLMRGQINVVFAVYNIWLFLHVAWCVGGITVTILTFWV